jgi:hypothetical protein
MTISLKDLINVNYIVNFGTLILEQDELLEINSLKIKQQANTLVEIE